MSLRKPSLEEWDLLTYMCGQEGGNGLACVLCVQFVYNCRNVETILYTVYTFVVYIIIHIPVHR